VSGVKRNNLANVVGRSGSGGRKKILCLEEEGVLLIGRVGRIHNGGGRLLLASVVKGTRQNPKKNFAGVRVSDGS